MTDRLLLTEKTLKAFSIKHFLLHGDVVMASSADGVVVCGGYQFDINGDVERRPISSFCLIDSNIMTDVRNYFAEDLENAVIERVWWNDDKSYIIPAFSSIKLTTVRRNSKTWNDCNIEGAIIAWHMEACRSAKKAIYDLHDVIRKNQYPTAFDDWTNMKEKSRKILYGRAKNLSDKFIASGLIRLMSHSTLNSRVKKWKKYM